MRSDARRGLRSFGPARAARLPPRREARRWRGREIGSSGSAAPSAPTTPPAPCPMATQRRLEIARAMCADPALLCLDEPAAGLNPRESADLAQLLLAIRDDHGIVDTADRARHVAWSWDFRPYRRARLWPEDRRRLARARCASDPAVIAAYLGVEEGSMARSRTIDRGGAATSALLSIRGATAYYGNVEALKGVDLEVGRGRDRRADRRQRRRQVDADDDDLRQRRARARAESASTAATSRDCRPMRSRGSAIAQSPEGRRIFPRMTRL